MPSRAMAPYGQRTGEIIMMTNTLSNPYVAMLTVLVLACFVGYYVVWKVTPALHTPLMSVTNAISSIIILGAIIAAAATTAFQTSVLSSVAVFIASVNIFGGFIVTWRML